jgi:hypothetical protein
MMVVTTVTTEIRSTWSTDIRPKYSEYAAPELPSKTRD